MQILVTQHPLPPSLAGPALCPANEVIHVDPDNGHAIVNAGKGLDIDEKDGKGRPAHLRASDERIKAAAAARAEADKAAKAEKSTAKA